MKKEEYSPYLEILKKAYKKGQLNKVEYEEAREDFRLHKNAKQLYFLPTHNVGASGSELGI